MQGTTHMAIGFMTGSFVSFAFHVPLYLPVGAVLTVAIVGSIVPDIDHPDSKISHDVKGFGAPFRLFSHRGVTHSFLALIIVALVLFFLRVQLTEALAFFLAYTSHLAADAMTKSGIRLWWPSQRRFWLLPRGFRVTTGTWPDYVLGFMSLIVAMGFLVLRVML